MDKALINEVMDSGKRVVRRGRTSLEDVHQMLRDGSCSVLSLDIFDTVLWRRVPRPTDLFAVLGRRLVSEGAIPSWVDAATFRRMRIVAEADSRERRGDLGPEVSLFDIWREMPTAIMLRGDIDFYVEAEIAEEYRTLVPDLDIAAIIDTAHAHSIPIILVSDTYFLQEHLDRFLDQPGLEPLKSARFFRSHEHGVDKADGLWKIVVKALGVLPGQIVHIGDNKRPDVTVPGKLGVRTVHFTRIGERYEPILRRERSPLEPFGPCAPRLDLTQGDFGITSLRAKLIEDAQLDEVAPDVACAWRYGASVLGPVLTGFAEWAARRAHEEGTSVLWCPMREGEMLSTLINNAALRHGLDVTAKPVWLSRHLTSVAALGVVDQDSIHTFMRRRHGMTIGGLLGILQLRPGDVPALSARLGTVLDNGIIADDVATALTESPALRNRIATTATATRERLLAHLRSVGALESGEITLVDLGWGATIQSQLATALELAGIEIKPAGLYLATDTRSTKVALRGLRLEGYLGSAGEPAEIVGPLVRSPEVLEQGVSSLCGSLLDFTPEGEPILAPIAGSASQIHARAALHEGVHSFQNEWLRYASEFSDWPAFDGGEVVQLGNILASSIISPIADEAAVFGAWEHEDNFGSDLVSHVVPADLLPAVPYLSPGDLGDLLMRDSFWPQVLAATDPKLAAAAEAVNSGAVPAEVFEPDVTDAETVLRYRTGDGKWHDGPKVPLRINRNGLSFARLNFEAFDATDISLAIPGCPALVRVDWIEATVTSGGHRLPEPLRWEHPGDFSGLVYAESTWLGGNLVEFHAPHSALWLPLAARAGAPVSTAAVTIAFAVLPQSLSGLQHRPPSGPRLARLTARAKEEYRAGGPLALAAGVARIVTRAGGPPPPPKEDDDDDDK
ncbi:HAD family hydrolase [Williamsia sp.]|uniref:HAD family hydrolase n=1 Tax=Williamsia sp. TaxID=1872085 RepID=UPI002F928C52